LVYEYSWAKSPMISGYATSATSGAGTAYPSGVHLSSPPVFTGVCVTRSLVLYVCFVDRCLYFCTFSFGHCVVCSSSIYEFWLPLWYLQTLLKDMLDFAQQISTPFGSNYFTSF
jgi:hypothetical protein